MSEPNEFTIYVPRTFKEGWGVHVDTICAGEDEPERITAIEVTVVRIDARAAETVGGVPCLPVGENLWVPIEIFRELPDLTEDDTHDLRDRWFATEQEARDHAESVRESWDSPLPWVKFIRLD